MAKPHGRERSKSESSANSFQDHSKKTGNLHGEKSGKSVISRPSTKCVKSEPKSSNKAIEPCTVHKKGSSFQDHYGSFKTISDGSKKDTFQDHYTSFKTIVNRVNSLNPRYMVPTDEVTLVISDPKSMKKVEKVVEQPSSSPPPPGSQFNPIYVEPGSVTIDSTRDLQALYPNSFDCIGDMQGEYDIKVDPTVPPVQHSRQKVPIKYKEEIEKELAEMVHQRIITKQTEPTPWVSSLTYPKKANGKLRICLDPKDLNKAIIRENHKAPTLEEIAHVLTEATKFSKVDSNKAFFGMHLMEEVSLLTMFNTHLRRYRFLHVPFGLKMSQDIFQMWMDDIVAQCPRVLAIHDDVFIYRKDDRDHNANIINLFNVAQKEGLMFNSKKCSIKQESVTFFGGVFFTEGYSPNPEKIQGISEMTPPQMKQELQSFLGAVNYLQTFVPHLSLNTEPLCALLKKENCFAWDKNMNTCFQKIKSQLQKALLRPLRYYDQTKPVTLQCDASLKGLGACIIQDRQPIVFASKSLMDTETCYANIKRALSDCLWLWKIPHVPVWEDIHHGNRPQAPRDDQPEKSHSSPCMTPENAPPSAAVWPDHNIQTRQGNASGRCPQLSPIQNQHWDQVRPMSRCHINLHILPETSHQDSSRDAMRPHPLDSAPTHPEQLAQQTRSCPQSSQILLELPRWALHWWWPPHQGWTSGHSTILQRQYNDGPPWKPCWHQ